MEVMVDIETTGLSPDRNGILQIAAVCFDLKDGRILGENVFVRSLRLMPHRGWDEGTREWWLKDKRALLQKIMSTQEDPRVVLKDFQKWVLERGNPNFWAKPTSFDFPFLQSHFNDCEMSMPFNFRHAIDCRSYVVGRATSSGIKPLDEKELSFVGEQHNALDDVFHQIGWVMQVHNDTELKLVNG
ncbi:MAG: hypothetical protein GC184_06150 [Rhizobiales bacterium]|nr:hypothetical protein [Hyphomicrobiales bacterium]